MRLEGSSSGFVFGDEVVHKRRTVGKHKLSEGE